MDEVSEKTGITLKSCRRQYDNVKRVFKVVEDLPGSLAANIEQHFLLSEDLAKYNIKLLLCIVLPYICKIYLSSYVFIIHQTICCCGVHSVS